MDRNDISRGRTRDNNEADKVSPADLTRQQRAMIGQTLDDALAGNAANLKIQVEIGKAAVRRRLQTTLRSRTGRIPVECVELPRQ